MSRHAVAGDAAFEAGRHAKSRVTTACDRCRLKKSRCDGKRPCNRCTADNQICLFGGGRTSENKHYPKGYVDLLLYQQRLLIKAVQVMYRQGQGDGSGGPDETAHQSIQVRIHDILDRLGVLAVPSAPGDPMAPDNFHFEEDPLQMQMHLESSTNTSQGTGADNSPEVANANHVNPHVQAKEKATLPMRRSWPNTLDMPPANLNLNTLNLNLPTIQSSQHAPGGRSMTLPGPSISPPAFFDPYSFPSPDPLMDTFQSFSTPDLNLDSASLGMAPSATSTTASAEALDQQTRAAIEYLRNLRSQEGLPLVGGAGATDAISSGFRPATLTSPPPMGQAVALPPDENVFMSDARWDDEEDYL